MLSIFIFEVTFQCTNYIANMYIIFKNHSY